MRSPQGWRGSLERAGAVGAHPRAPTPEFNRLLSPRVYPPGFHTFTVISNPAIAGGVYPSGVQEYGSGVSPSASQKRSIVAGSVKVSESVNTAE